MKKYVGVWLDHREAFVVSLTREQPAFSVDQEMIERIESNIESRTRLSGGSRSRRTPYGPQDISVDSKQEDRFKLQRRKYFEEVLLRLSDADKILIFGPGEAKIELKKKSKNQKSWQEKSKKLNRPTR